MYMWAAIATLIGWPLMLIARKPYGSFCKKVMLWWTKPVYFFGGVKLNVVGRENIQSGENYIVCSNHLDILDIPTLILATELNIRFAAKKELFRIPIFGWLLSSMGMISVDRENRRKAVASIKKIEHLITTEPVSVVLFPEGTRNKTGGGLLPFKKGAFAMSSNTQRKILPVSLNDTSKIFTGMIARPRTLDVYIHPPIDPQDFSAETRSAFMEKTYEAILSKIE